MHKNPLISYFVILSFFSIAICFVALFAVMLLKDVISVHIPYYIFFYYILTAAGYSFIYYKVKKHGKKFENIFMLVKYCKLFLSLILFAVILSLGIEKNIPFTVQFLTLYLLYLIFDTITIRRFVKKLQ